GDPCLLPSLRLASAAVIDGLDGNFQEWLSAMLAVEVDELFGGVVPQGKNEIDYNHESNVKKLAGGAKLQPGQIEEIYRAWRHDHEPRLALAYTLQDSL